MFHWYKWSQTQVWNFVLRCKDHPQTFKGFSSIQETATIPHSHFLQFHRLPNYTCTSALFRHFDLKMPTWDWLNSPCIRDYFLTKNTNWKHEQFHYVFVTNPKLLLINMHFAVIHPHCFLYFSVFSLCSFSFQQFSSRIPQYLLLSKNHCWT